MLKKEGIMKFKKAFKAMKHGQNIKLPSWDGYWCWDEDKEIIIMRHIYEKSKEKIYISETHMAECTITNILSDEWVFADENNVQTTSGIQLMSFGTALNIIIQRGKGMRLKQWEDDVVIRVQYPDNNSKMTAPYLYVESRYGRVPWKETMIEMFSKEWEIVD